MNCAIKAAGGFIRATVAELEAIFGWLGGGMASLYTRAADRARLAKGTMAKLDRTPGEQSIPAPSGKVRRAKEIGDFSTLGFQWCGREDSNLHELPH